MLELINERTRHSVASAVEVALTRRERRKGLLGRNGLDLSAALVIAPCWSIHTIGMRFAIDVVFVDGDGVVLRVVHDLVPWRMAWAPGAYAAVEFAAGVVAARGVQAGDRLYARSADGFRSPALARGPLGFRQMVAKPACSGS